MAVQSKRRKQSHAIPGILLLALMAVLVACNPNAPCNQETRTVDSNGSIGPVGAEEIVGGFSVVQLMNHSDDRYGFIFSTAIYKGHITSLTMYPASDPTRTLATFPITAPASANFSQGTSSSHPAALGATLTELYDLLSADGVRIRAQTDLAAPKSLDFPLVIRTQTGWTKAGGCYG